MRTGFAMLLVATLGIYLGLSGPNTYHLAAAIVGSLAALFIFFHGRVILTDDDGTSDGVGKRRHLAAITSGAVVLIAALHLIAMFVAIV